MNTWACGLEADASKNKLFAKLYKILYKFKFSSGLAITSNVFSSPFLHDHCFTIL